MKTVSLSGLKNNFDHFYEVAHVERVHITEDGEDKVVMLPYAVFEQLRKASPRMAVHVSDLPEEAIKAVLEAKIPDEAEPEKGSGS